MTNLFTGLRRGRGKGDIGEQSLEHFLPIENIARAAGLRFNPTNPAGMILLGLIDAEMHGTTSRERCALGGKPIGIRPDMHITTIAGTRAGKSRAALVPNLLYYPGSMLVIDPKGDLAYQTANWRRQGLSQAVYVADPYEVAGDVGERFASAVNPLEILQPDSQTLLDDASVIADSVVVAGGNDPHWDESAKAFLEAVCIHVATAPLPKYEGKRDLISVHRALQHDVLEPHPHYEETTVLQDEMERNLAAGGAVIAGCNAFFDSPEKERASKLSTLRRHTHFLGYEGMKKVLRGTRTVDLRQLKREPSTIYLSLPASRMGPCRGWLRLMVNLLMTAMEEDTTKPPYPVIAVLDEFHVLGHMDRLATAAGQLAGLDLLLWVVLQDLGQLKAAYKETWETFLGNSGLVLCYGNSDQTTLEYIEKRLGKTTVLSPSMKDASFKSETESGETGRSWSHSLHPLMTTSEISAFFGRDDPLHRLLVLRPQFRPMILQRAFYDRHSLFTGRFQER